LPLLLLRRLLALLLLLIVIFTTVILRLDLPQSLCETLSQILIVNGFVHLCFKWTFLFDSSGSWQPWRPTWGSVIVNYPRGGATGASSSRTGERGLCR
jgi:hypothetical protein